MEAVITTKELRKSFRGRKATAEAVKGISFEVGRGEIFGFLGPNGAGKTTTLRMLTTLLPIDSGAASVAGSDVTREPKQVRQRIGYVSQAGGADDLSTGWENLILQGRLYGGDLDSVRQRAKELARCSTSPNSPIGRSRPIREASAGGSTSPSGSFTNPRSCSSTSPPPASIRRTGRICGTTFGPSKSAGRRSF